MPEIKDSPPPVVNQEKPPKSEIKRILDVTKRFFDHKITVIGAFHEIADHNYKSKETPESTVITPTKDEIKTKQDKTNQEINNITKELKADLPPEPLIDKNKDYLLREKELGTFIDSNRTQYEKYHSDSMMGPVIDKISSAPYILKLKISGVKKATDFYNVLRERGFNDDQITDKETIKNLKDLTPADIGRGIDIINKLGFSTNDTNEYKSFGYGQEEIYISYDNIAQSISAASKITEDNFNNVCSELNPYFFLKSTKLVNGCDDYDVNPSLKTLLETAKNGHLNPEVKNRLDIIKELFILRKDRDDFDRRDNLSYVAYITLNNEYVKANLENVFNTKNEIAFKLPDGKELNQEIFNSNFKFIYKNLDKFMNPYEFIKNISQEQIKDLSGNKNGFVDFLRKVYEVGESCNYDSRDSAKKIIKYVAKNQDKIKNSSFKEESQQLQFILDLAKSTSPDPDNKDQADFISDLNNIYFSGKQDVYDRKKISFSNEQDQTYWETISKIKNSSLLKTLINDKNQLFDENNSPTPSFFKTIVKSGEDIYSYDRGSLSDIFFRYLDTSISNFPLKDKLFWSIGRNMFNYSSGQKYFSKIDELSELINQTDGIDPKFFDKVVADYGEYFLRIHGNGQNVNNIITDEVLDALPPQDKVFWKLYQDFSKFYYQHGSSTIDQLFEIKDNFSQYFDKNDNLNSLFFEKMAKDFTSENNYINIFNSYLTEENINKLDAPDKIFWGIYKSFSFEKSDIDNRRLSDQRRGIKDFLINNKDNFKSNYLNKENQITSSFITDIMKIEDHSGYLLLSISDELKPLLATESIFNNLIPEEKLFWKDYLNADIYNYNEDNQVRDILLENKDDYKKFIDSNGHPTPFLFESVYGWYNIKHSFGGCKLLNQSKVSDEDMSNFSPLEKIFWTTYRDSFWPDGKDLTNDLKYGESIRYFLLNNYLIEGSDFSKFIDQDFKLNSLFLEENIQGNCNLSNRFLTEEKLSNFSSQDRKSFEIIRNNNRQYFNKFIINHKDQINDLFDDQNNPTFLFYKTIVSEGNTLGKENWKHLLTFEQIANFPEENKHFWNGLKSIFNKEYPDGIIDFLLNNQDKATLYFNPEGQLTSECLKVLISEKIYISKTLLSPENIINLNDQDKNIYSLFSDLYNNANCPSKELINFFADNISDFSKFLENNKPNSLFFGSLLTSKFDISKELISKYIDNFKDDQDKAMWSLYRDIYSSNFGQQENFKNFFADNISDFSKFLDQDNHFNSHFLESLLTSKFNIPIEVISKNIDNFKDIQDKKIWELLIKFNKGKTIIEGNEINKLIIENKNQINDIFENQEKIEFITSDKNLDIKIGKVFNKLSSSECLKINKDEINKTADSLLKQDQIEINKSNWKSILKFYIYSQDEDNTQINPELKTKMKVLFEDPKVRNLCLSELQSEWRSYLNSGKPEELPFSLKLLSEFIKDEGAGPLGQIKSLGLLIDSVYNSFLQKTTTEETKNEILTGFSEIEARFIKNRWSNEDKTNFYNISRDVIDADPSLFSDYLTLFKKLSPSELVSFSKDIYPLYKTKLVLMEKIGRSDKKYYEKNDLLDLKKDIQGFTDFDSKKEELLKDIKERFSTRFGIIKTPENFSQENIRSIKDISMYLSNIAKRTPEKEAILGFYLSLNINNRWNDFRNGQEINPREYLSESKSVVIENFLEERKKTTKTIVESVGIEDKNIPEFIKLLQEETTFEKRGDVETIDIKLNNIIQNLKGLQDLDLYPDPLDKQRMNLLQTWGNKEVGSTVAKMCQQLLSPEKNISLSENETQIKDQLIDICKTNELYSNDPQILKENFQEGIKVFSTLINIFSSVEKLDVLGEIGKLKNYLEPSPEIIEIFQKIGEDFKVSSGAMALSQDLDYLDNLVVKKEDLIKLEDREIISKYITTIRTQVSKLEEIYGQVKNKFENLKQGNLNSKNGLFNKKLKEIETIINSQSTQQLITSTATNNLNVITENMRECLACTTNGCNNDTDLTFGDINKFYLYSQSENQSKGSISDQLAYLEPVTRQNGSQEASFIIDKLYGYRTPSILEYQVETVIKKARIIKQRFPNTKTSVFVSSIALSSSGTPNETLIKKLHDDSKISAQSESIEVNIIKSAAADHYIEIGGEPRTTGKRTVSGIIINI